MNTVLWLIIGVVVTLIAAGVLIPELLSRSRRKQEKKLGHRAKRRIQL